MWPESIFGVVGVAQDTAANAKDHRPMSAHHRLEGTFVLLLDIARQQIGIRSGSILLLLQRAPNVPGDTA